MENLTMRKKITISMQEIELELMDKRAKELGLTRSSYIKCIFWADKCKAENTFDPRKRRITDFSEDQRL